MNKVDITKQIEKMPQLDRIELRQKLSNINLNLISIGSIFTSILIGIIGLSLMHLLEKKLSTILLILGIGCFQWVLIIIGIYGFHLIKLKEQKTLEEYFEVEVKVRKKK